MSFETGGPTLWRGISDELTKEIDTGVLAPGARLPADVDLAVRFGVNRHTVRRALTHLKEQGMLRVVQGQGTFVVDDVTEYMLGAGTRFTQNLLMSQRTPGRRLISVARLPADARTGEALELPQSAEVALVNVVGEADGKPISFGRNYFSCARLPTIAEAFLAYRDAPGERLSITAVLKSVGIGEYRRKLTKISCRPPSAEEVKHLRIPQGEYVLETECVDVTEDEQPLVYAKTAFRSSAVRFILET